jgi:protein TonB
VNNIDRAAGLYKLVAATMLALVATVPAGGASAKGQTPKASCSSVEQPATMLFAAPADYPEIAKATSRTGITIVRVHLSKTGAAQDVTVARSSGSKDLDAAALVAARDSSYRPEAVNCQAKEGDYLIDVDFE